MAQLAWQKLGTRKINDIIVNGLKNIVDEKPELCLDETVDELGNRIGVCLLFKTIWLTLHEKC